MPDVTLILFHTPPRATDPPLTRLLGEARRTLAERHAALFRRAGVDRIVVAAGRGVRPADDLPARAGRSPGGMDGADATPPPGAPGPGRAGDVADAASRGDAASAAMRPPAATPQDAARPAMRPPAGPLPPPRPAPGTSFGEALAALVRDEALEACVVMGDGAVPRLRLTDAARLIGAARAGGRTALTNNRYSSDVCAVADAAALRELPALPSDNALPRWLEEIAGFEVRELQGRDRLGLDIDSPLDMALLALATDAPASLRTLATREGIDVPRLADLRAIAADPRRELLVFGRSSSRALAWLEGHARCRVRFLAEERGLRASSPLAIGHGAAAAGGAHDSRTEAGPGARGPARHPRATIGRLLDREGTQALGRVIAGLADAAILDSRVLLADRLGADEANWPNAEDRFASDLLRADRVDDPWLRELTAAALAASFPIVLGGHTLVGPGVPLLFPARRREGALR